MTEHQDNDIIWLRHLWSPLCQWPRHAELQVMTHLRQDVTDLHGNAFEVEAAMAMAFPQNYLILDYHQILSNPGIEAKSEAYWRFSAQKKSVLNQAIAISFQAKTQDKTLRLHISG